MDGEREGNGKMQGLSPAAAKSPPSVEMTGFVCFD